MAKKLKTHETSKFLSFGEKLRENPKTILLSIPVFLFSAPVFLVSGDKEKLSGSFGHLGLTFKLYYDHRLKLKLFLNLAGLCFKISTKFAPLKQKPAVLLQLGLVLTEMEKFKKAEAVFNRAAEIAQRVKDFPLLGFVFSKRGKFYLKQKKMDLAWADFQKALDLIEAGIKKRKSSFYYQIWLSGLEVDLSNFWIISGKKDEALKWAQKAEARAKEFDLKTRKTEIEKLIKSLKIVPVFLLGAIFNYLS